MSTSSVGQGVHVDERGAGVEHAERVQVHDSGVSEPFDFRRARSGLVSFVLVEHHAVLARKRLRPALELVAGGAEAVQADEPVNPPVRVVVAMQLRAQLGYASLEFGRCPREQHLALERAEMLHHADVVPQVGGGQPGADAGCLDRRRHRSGVEHRARLDDAGVARVQ